MLMTRFCLNTKILPQRLQEWQLTPCKADEQSKKALEDVRKKQIEAQNKLRELDEKIQVRLPLFFLCCLLKIPTYSIQWRNY